MSNPADFTRNAEAAYRRLVDKFGAERVQQAVETYPSAVGVEPDLGSFEAAVADQLDAALQLSDRLAETVYLHSARGFMAVHVGGDRLGTFRAIADRAFTAYCGEFGVSTVNPETHLTGFTVEKDGLLRSTQPDTRVYAILARWPFERTPVATQADLNALLPNARSHNMCDLRLKSDLCDEAIWSNSVLLPIVRADVIVLVAVCGECWKVYCAKYGISNTEIIDPDDEIN